MRNWIKFFFAYDSRREQRDKTSLLVTYYWDGESATPAAQGIKDISPIGLYLLTERRWYLGTLIMMTLQLNDAADEASEETIAVLARVIRSGPDGVGFEFIYAGDKDAQRVRSSDRDRIANRPTLEQFLQRLRNENAPLS